MLEDGRRTNPAMLVPLIATLTMIVGITHVLASDGEREQTGRVRGNTKALVEHEGCGKDEPCDEIDIASDLDEGIEIFGDAAGLVNKEIQGRRQLDIVGERRAAKERGRGRDYDWV